VIDWEMADIGDACWDAGAIFQAYLSFWIYSLPLAAGLPLEEAAASSPFTVSEMQPALAAYWASYAGARGLRPAESQAALERSMACAAARMIQTAYEGIQQMPQLTPQALCQLQMSMNILRDPQAAIRDFLAPAASAPS
jgi:aminoglycoside phosphotransferase (APT) family kinase protein